MSTGSFLEGMHFEPLPADWSPLGAVVLVKCLDAQGRPSWSFRTSSDLNDEEVLGALRVRTSIQEQDLLEAYTAVDDEPDI